LSEPVSALLTVSATATAVHAALVHLGCEAGVRRGVAQIGARLSLGKLDPNHDIARAACKIACNIDPLRGLFASNSDPL
jgi:hypothetical protein